MELPIESIVVDCRTGIVRYLDANGRDVLPPDPKPDSTPIEQS